MTATGCSDAVLANRSGTHRRRPQTRAVRAERVGYHDTPMTNAASQHNAALLAFSVWSETGTQQYQ
jgi:hypothetical protein